MNGCRAGSSLWQLAAALAPPPSAPKCAMRAPAHGRPPASAAALKWPPADRKIRFSPAGRGDLQNASVGSQGAEILCHSTDGQPMMHDSEGTYWVQEHALLETASAPGPSHAVIQPSMHPGPCL